MSYLLGVTLGQLGSFVEVGTTSVEAPANRHFSAIQIISNAKFSALNNLSANPSGDNLHNAIASSATEIPAGTILYGTFKNFQLHSGAVIAYYGS